MNPLVTLVVTHSLTKLKTIDHETAETVQQTTIRKKQQLLDEKLKTYKQDKMKRKLSVDSQIPFHFKNLNFHWSYFSR